MKTHETLSDLAERFDLPQEALTGAVRITLTGRRRATVEYHRGLVGYSPELVEISADRGSVRILGTRLELRAMDAQTLVVTGHLTAVEYA